MCSHQISGCVLLPMSSVTPVGTAGAAPASRRSSSASASATNALPKQSSVPVPRGESAAFHRHLVRWMERVESKLDKLAGADSTTRMMTSEGNHNNNGISQPQSGCSVLSWQQDLLGRSMSRTWEQQRQVSAGTTLSSTPEPPHHKDCCGSDHAMQEQTTWSSGETPDRSQSITSAGRIRQNRERALLKRMNSEFTSTKHGRCARFVLSQHFDCMVTSIILLNAMLIGVQVQLQATSDVDVAWFGHLELACTGIFTIELAARFGVHGWLLFTDPRERSWNMFDSFLVALSWVDMVINKGLPGSTAFLTKLGRVIRLFRVVRLVRTVRFLSQLRVLMNMIMSTFLSLFWMMLILIGILFCFAVILTQGATEYLHPPDHQQLPSDYESVKFMYGSLFQTMYTLFQCMSGGINWGQASYLMRGPGWALEAVVIVYVFFTIFAVVNIVNGVFVDGAIELAKQDRLLFVEKQKIEDQAKEIQLIDLLKALDSNDDNMITFLEFSEGLERKDITEYFSALQIDVEDAKAFFSLLDVDGSGEVNLFEFVTGMEKLRGEAKSADVHIVKHQNKIVLSVLHSLVEQTLYAQRYPRGLLNPNGRLACRDGQA